MVYLKHLKKIAQNNTDAPNLKLHSVTAGLVVLLFCGTLVGFFFHSVFDTDATVSESENRALATMPSISVKALSDGTFMTDFEAYYADTFPRRDQFLALNQKITAIFSGVRGKEDVVLVAKTEKDDFAGQDIDYDE